MKSEFRKIVSVLLAFVFAFTLLPANFTAQAAATETLVAEGGIGVNGSTFAFGPYITLEPGEYAVYFEGSDMNGTWKVGVHNPACTLAEGNITNPSAFSIRFSVNKRLENVEVWLFGSGTCTARRIMRIRPGELVSEGGIGVTSAHIAYGPYCSLPTGSYRVYFYGENMTGRYDVVGSGGTYAAGTVPSSTAFAVDFAIPSDATSIEARIEGSGTCHARQIWRIEPGELVAEGGIGVSGSHTSYGPYIDLVPGFYTAEYTGANMSGTWDVTYNSGESKFASGSIPNASAFSVDFAVNKNTSGVEVRTMGGGTVSTRRIYRRSFGTLIHEGTVPVNGGFIAYGPYLDLPAGKYVAEIEGENMSGEYRITRDNGATWVTGNTAIPNASAFTFPFELTQGCSRVEVVLTGTGTVNYRRIYRVTEGGGNLEYTLNFNNGGADIAAGTASAPVDYMSQIPASIAVPQKTGYTFKGYYTGANGDGTQYYNESGSRTFTGAYDVNGNTTLYANWQINTYTVTFKSPYAASALKTETVNYGSAATAPEVEQYVKIDGDNAKHMKFTGWDRSFSAVAGDLTVTAVYAEEAHDFTGFTKTDDNTHTHTCVKCGYTETLGHNWVLESSGDSTCIAHGSEVYKCSDCNAEKTVELPYAAHQYTAQTVSADRLVSAATCQQKAVYYYSCAVCGEAGSETFEYGDFADHKFETYVSNNDATCQRNCTETAECVFGCGETDTREIPDSAVAHKFETYVSDDNATCQRNCTETAECVYGCGETDTRDIPDSTVGHKFETYVSDDNATCQRNCTETAECVFGCGETDTREIPDSTVAHKFETYVSDDNATCQSNCTETAECAFGCGETDTREIPDSTVAHKFETYVSDDNATCQSNCTETAHCAFGCGETDTREIPDSCDYEKHSTTETVTKNAKSATCYEDGYTGDVYCAACDHLIAAGETIAKETVAHMPVKTEATASTCTEKGNIEYYTCSECGRIFEDEACNNEITAEQTVLDFDYANHSTAETVTKDAKPATCNADGYTGDIYCKACGRLLEEGEAIPNAGAEHVFGAWYVKTAPTCTEDGEEERVCENCGETEIRPVSALGHDWGEWTDDAQNAPSCTKDGRQNRTCARCGETETREITASEKGHAIRVPNEENEGYCASCGQYRCLFCEKDEHMHETDDSSIVTFFIHVVHYFYHLFSNFRYTLSHR